MPRTRLSRLREYQVSERPALDALLDEARLGHVGFEDDGDPVVLPTAIARSGDTLLAHGSTGSRWMRRVAEGAPVCVEVTVVDAIMVARSAFESSFRYRSAVLFGRFACLEGDDKLAGLDVLVDKLIPGRLGEVRPSNRRELNKTMVLALPIAEWSLKVSGGWPEDDPADLDTVVWAGVVPLAEHIGEPISAPDLRPGIPVPPSVTALSRSGSSPATG